MRPRSPPTGRNATSGRRAPAPSLPATRHAWSRRDTRRRQRSTPPRRPCGSPEHRPERSPRACCSTFSSATARRSERPSALWALSRNGSGTPLEAGRSTPASAGRSSSTVSRRADTRSESGDATRRSRARHGSHAAPVLRHGGARRLRHHDRAAGCDRTPAAAAPAEAGAALHQIGRARLNSSHGSLHSALPISPAGLRRLSHAARIRDRKAVMPPAEAAPDTGLTLRQYYVMVGLGAFVTTIAQPGVIGRLPLQLLLKQELHFTAQTLAAFMLIATFAWNVKPVAGILSDAFPLFGTRRRHYMLLGSGLAALCWFL